MENVRYTLRKLKPFIGKKAEKLWLLYQTSDFRTKKELEDTVINVLAQKYLKTFEDEISFDPIPKELCKGEIYLGDVIQAGKRLYPLYIPIDTLCLHMGFMGSTGCGKTNALYNLVTQLLDLGIKIQFFDWKQGMRHLLSIPKYRDKIRIYSLGTDIAPICFNPLIPPENKTIDPVKYHQLYAQLLSEIIGNAYLGGLGVRHVIEKGIFDCYELFGIFDGNKNYPTFSDVAHYVRKKFIKRGRKMLWLDSAERIFTNFQSTLGSVILTQKPLDIESFTENNIILEMDYLVAEDRTFIINAILLHNYFYKLMNPQNRKLNVIGIEEAHNILSLADKGSLMEKMFRELRELRTGIVYALQNATHIPNSVFQNTNTVIGFNQRLQYEVRKVGGSLLLGKEDYYLGRLKVGEAIVKVGNYPKPFEIKFPLFRISKNVTDEDIRSHMQGYSGHSHLNIRDKEKLSGIRGIREIETLSPLAKILLVSIYENPFLGIVKRYKLLGLSTADGHKAQKELLSFDYVKPVNVNGFKLLELTAKGKIALAKMGVKVRLNGGRGGLEHRFYLDRLKKYYIEKGYFTYLEKDNIDLIAEKGSEVVAVQVETGKSNTKKNILALREYKAHRKIVIATNKQAEHRAREIVAKLCKDSKIQVSFIKDFLSVFG